ncbi:SDR family NAD(P)-dependent oxidoreductase, partial [Gordonibacter pamelaeae]|uniref:SDR family NAD(P)-dependent oxidoreductase n=1 Tax=Gordonibacter pamelaeae TaxID=471189 RepID=UPI0039C9CF39
MNRPAQGRVRPATGGAAMKEFFANRFEGKAMIVTGAARGIGEAVALRAAQEGARLMLADRREA